MDRNTVNIIKIGLSVLMAGGLLWLSFRGVQWPAFIEGIKSCKWAFVALSLLIGAVSFWIRALRWRELLLPIDPHTKKNTVLNAINISYVVNMLIPRGGELVRCGIITRHSAKDKDGARLAGFDKVVGTVVVDRVWDTVVTIFILLGVFYAFRRKWGDFFEERMEATNFSSLWIILLLALAAVLVVVLSYALRSRGGLFAKVWKFFHGIISGIRQSLKMKAWWKFITYTVLLWTCYWGTSYAVLLALSGSGMGFESLGPLDGVFLMGVGAIASIIPVPGGFGAYHYLVSASLATVYGIPPEQGMIFAVLSHETQIIVQMLCGAGSYVHETVRRTAATETIDKK